jgi:uncharacterized membrane protein
MDRKSRSWAKSLTWRIVGVFILGAISYAITRDWGKTTIITVIFHAVRLILYYFHERLWEIIPWGRVKHPLSHLPMKEDLTEEDLKTIERLLAEGRYLAERPEYEI